MKRLLILSLAGLLAISATAQEKGMYFEHGLSWNQILAKAKAENKLVFVDCYTTWCGPCKMMEKGTFSKEKVGAFYNKYYINVRLQMDSTSNDSPEIKSHYAEARDIAIKYKIAQFPTLLFFDANGKLVDHTIGKLDENLFLKLGNSIVDPNKRLDATLQAFKAHPNDTALLSRLTDRIGDLDAKTANIVTEKGLISSGGLLSPESTKFLFDKNVCGHQSASDIRFEIARKYPDLINKQMGKETAERYITYSIFLDEIRPIGMKDGNWDKLDWISIKKKIAQKYPKEAHMVIMEGKKWAVDFAFDPKRRLALAESFIKEYNGKAHTIAYADALNTFAIGFVEGSSDPKMLHKALSWSKQAASTPGLNNKDAASYKSVYSCLLYKIGRKEEAIKVGKEVVRLAEETKDDLTETYKDILARMEKGDKELFPKNNGG